MSRFLCLITLMSSLLMGAVAYAAERVVIYTSAEEYRNAYFEERLKKAFPQYEIILDYMPTGNQAAKLMSEGRKLRLVIFPWIWNTPTWNNCKTI